MKRLLFSLFFVYSVFITLPVEAAELVILKNVQKTDVVNFLVTYNLKTGATIKSTSEYNLTFEDNSPKSNSFMLYWGTSAKVFHVYNFVQSGSDLTLSYEIQIVTDPGSAHERTHIAAIENAKTYFPGPKETLETGALKTKETLRTIKAVFNGIYIYGFNYDMKKKKNSIEITKVSQNEPAQLAGILPGDRIVKINDISIKSLSLVSINNLIMDGDEGASIKLDIIRDGKEMSFTLIKHFFPPTFIKQ